MTLSPDSELTPLERVEDVPRILRAMAEAVREASLRHKRLGNPVAVWQDGRVVWLAPEEIPVEDVPVPEPIRVPPPRVDPEGRAPTTTHKETPRP
jgi:hypothetical protein